MGGWFIPITVTAGGNLVSKLLEWVHIVPKPPKDKTSRDHVVRIWAGMDFSRENSKTSSLAGGIPDVVLWNERGDYAGSHLNHKEEKGIGEGDFYDVLVNYEKHNARAPYVQLRASNIDAICVSAVQLIYPDGGTEILLGDIPTKLCGWKGYRSMTENPLPGSDGSNTYQPWCFWLDGDDSYGRSDEAWAIGKNMPKSVSFHIKDFDGNGTIDAYQKNPGLICNSAPRLYASNDRPDQLHMFNPPLIYHGPDANNLDEKVVDKWPMTEKRKKPKKNKSYLPRKKRASDGDDAAQAEKGPKFHEMHELWWTLSNSTKLDDTATVLCSMPNIDGPHWASLYDRKFCKMDDHTLWDLCDENIRSNCFDIESQQLWGEAAVAANDSSAVSALGLVSSPILNLQYRLGM
ncbi:hypothetical protein H2202_004965 [Exophiala xenobiotica]|nr:hypothetical protein H2202_004965 [Exophiala xenobiotica]KAK5216951.1 hypothetical protein LTR72_009946 [Exophiala xenobiotica]KAK5287613.1 hypothetical protein LTR14_008843 [Exophiala xenobiotica]KAK5314845.1 hypothetical protein LTR93_010228 [Exophiala xenobiotica]KAK5475480.1 hypothetical protein LTR55_009108 [Exophiala xenobiotica]